MGLVVLGDAVLALNPVYGQGITVSLMGALLLQQTLQSACLQRPDTRAVAMRAFGKVSQAA